MTAEFVLSELQSVGSPEKAAHLSRFFKTGPGQYGEGDRFLGVVVPQTRSIAKANKAMPLDELQRLLDSPWHEARLCALLVLVYRFQDKKTPETEREKMYRFYLKNTRRCNNWDLVDLSCRDIVGEYLVNRDRSVLYELAASDNLWEQRISIVCTWAFIRRSDFTDTLALAERLMTHKHDLMHKWAGIYNVRSFISDDPVQFPHRFTEKRDIEISAFITSWISYGRRELILRKADWLHSRMGGSPYEWVLSGRYWELVSDVPAGKRDTFYRFYTHSDLCALCDQLKEIYQRYDSLEDALAASSYPNPVFKLQDLFSGINGIPVMGGTSACKRLAMFLRWMVRTDGIVDFGIWQTVFHPRQLIIPLDTHVHQISLELGLTQQRTATLKTALEITEALSHIFPDDPCLGDFALFGYDINKGK